VSPPTPEAQIAFLASLQRLLVEGSFVSTYKYALLLALADLAVELGDDSGDALRLPVRRIAEKFVVVYWPQAAPFPGRKTIVLGQATGKPANIITLVEQARARSKSLAKLRADKREWDKLTTRVARVVAGMPLWRVQTIATGTLEFLYPNTPNAEHVELRPGVAFCLRRFHGLVEDLVRGAWVRFVRNLKANRIVLGDVGSGLDEFLFGSERNDLSAYRPVLEKIDGKVCFYCRDKLKSDAAVDHFVPWVRYPVDLGHNFVLAHGTCNGSKGDRIAAYDHLRRWCTRNEVHAAVLDAEFTRAKLLADWSVSSRVARWAYSQVEASSGHVWVSGDNLVALDGRWRSLPGIAAA